MAGHLDNLGYQDKPLAQWLAILQADPASPQDPDVWTGIGLAIEAAAGQLGRLAHGPQPEVRRRAVRALRELGEHLQWVVPSLQQSLKEVALAESDPVIQAEAVEALSQHLGPHAGLRPATLVEALRDQLPAVRIGAARALAESGPRGYAAVSGLIHATQWDPDPAVRVHAAVAIWKIDRRDRIAVPVLSAALREPDECLRWVAADCLGDIGAQAVEAIPALRAALADTYRTPLVKEAVRLALARIEQTPPA